jgi:DNA-binding Lrp family transcriptional regulator
MNRPMLVIARASAQAGLERECYAQVLDNAREAPGGVQPLEVFSYSEPGDVGLLCGVTEPSRFDDFFLDRVRNAPATLSAWCYTLFDGQCSPEYFELIKKGKLKASLREAIVSVRVETGVDRNVYPTLALLGWDGEVGVRAVFKTFHDEQTDYLVRIYGSSTDDLADYVTGTLRKVKGVLDTETTFTEKSRTLVDPEELHRFLDSWAFANDPERREAPAEPAPQRKRAAAGRRR